MAEFIFDLQRFKEGSDGGNSAGSGVSGGSEGGGGTNAGSGSGWEPRIRNKGEIIFPLFMTTEEADSFANAAWADYINQGTAGLVPAYYYQDNIIDTISISRLGHTSLFNDAYDIVNLVDANVGNIVEYFTFRNTDKALALVFDTGAVLDFDIDVVSPVFNFANGESMMYSAIEGKWLTGDEMTAAHDFWATAFRYSGTDIVDNFAVTQTVNTGLLDVSGEDNIYLYDTLAEEVEYSYEVTGNSITIVFPTGGSLVVDNGSTYSPNFIFADGSSQYYNRDLGEWRDSALKASDALDSYEAFELAAYEAGYSVVCDASLYTENMFPVTILASTFVYNTDSYDTIYFQDALQDDIELMYDTVEDGNRYLNLVFDTGAVTKIGYEQNFSPVLLFADGQTLGYDYRTDTWGTAYQTVSNSAEELSLSVWDNSLVYQMGANDTIYFADGSVANLVDVSTSDYYINLTFNTGTTTSVRYTDDYSPDFVFGGDPSTHYHYNYLEGWSSGTTFYANYNFADQFTLTRGANLFVYDTEASDTIYVPDATLENVVYLNANEYEVKFLFDTGTTAEVRYEGTASPAFVFAEGVPIQYNALTDNWNIGWDEVTTSADMASSADLWGDVAPADDLFAGGTIGTDATLSDLVAPVADVTSFNAGNAFDAQSTGEFVVVAADSSQKTA